MQKYRLLQGQQPVDNRNILIDIQQIINEPFSTLIQVTRLLRSCLGDTVIRRDGYICTACEGAQRYAFDHYLGPIWRGYGILPLKTSYKSQVHWQTRF